MPRKSKKGNLASFIREIISITKDLDGGLVELTGRSIKDYLNMIDNDSRDNVYKNLPKTDPYIVLGVTRTKPRKVIRQVYISLVKLYHESGAIPNADRLKEINNAWDEICKEKGWPK